MFDVGFWEFVLIAVITLIVVGPERMPALARTTGKYVGKLKRFITQSKLDLEDELDTKTIQKQFDLQENQTILDIVEEVKEIKDIDKQIVEKTIQPNNDK